MRALTVKDLIERLSSLDPGALVVVPGRDHSYSFASVEVTTALGKGSDLTEDHGDQFTPEGPEFGRRLDVVVVS